MALKRFFFTKSSFLIFFKNSFSIKHLSWYEEPTKKFQGRSLKGLSAERAERCSAFIFRDRGLIFCNAHHFHILQTILYLCVIAIRGRLNAANLDLKLQYGTCARTGQPTGLKFCMQTTVGYNFCFKHFALRALLHGSAPGAAPVLHRCNLGWLG